MLVVTSALLVVTMFASRNKCIATSNILEHWSREEIISHKESLFGELKALHFVQRGWNDDDISSGGL